MNSKIKIITCCHKQDIFYNSVNFLPIQVGKANSSVDLGIIGDNTGDNISRKNSSYCELTGMYWAWKNLKDIDYIGLCHYRRYFDFNHLGRKIFPLTTIKTAQFNNLNLDINKETLKWLEAGGCIVAKATHLYTSLFLHYCEGHYSKDFKVLGDIIRDTLPSKYFQSFWDNIVDSNKFCPFNMFIMNWEQFDKYCGWLFPLLEKVENKIDISQYSLEQQRIYGYMAERLLNLYIHAEGLRTRHIPILKISDEEEVDNMPIYKYIIRTILRDIAVKISFFH